MLSKFTDEIKKRNDEQEQRRIGDIYSECIRRGCKEDFLKAFDGRIWLYPVEQTVAFLDSRNDAKEAASVDNLLKQWKIYLQVIVDKRPNHQKANEWEKALKMLE